MAIWSQLIEEILFVPKLRFAVVVESSCALARRGIGCVVEELEIAAAAFDVPAANEEKCVLRASRKEYAIESIDTGDVGISEQGIPFHQTEDAILPCPFSQDLDPTCGGFSEPSRSDLPCFLEDGGE